MYRPQGDRKVRSFSGKVFPRTHHGQGQYQESGTKPDSKAVGGSMAQAVNTESVTQALSNALRLRFGMTQCAVKRIASSLKCNTRAARNWWEGHNAPSAVTLIQMMREFDEVYDVVMEMAGRRDADADESARVQYAMKILKGEIAPHEIDHNRVPRMGGDECQP